MCGRFTLRAPASTVAEQFQLLDVEPFGPRFNVAPTQTVAVVRVRPEGGEPRPRGPVSPRPATRVSERRDHVIRQLAWLKWGLIPSWAKDPAIGNSLINARAESVADKPAFRTAFRRRRCLVVADGFYEWQRTGAKKQPYFIRLRDDRPFGFAGLWESWEGPAGKKVSGTFLTDDVEGKRAGAVKKVPDTFLRLETCTIITTGPNELMEKIHNRMPVILAPEAYDRWLDPAIEKSEQLTPLLRPYPSDAMLALAVSTHVNNPRNDDPECIVPAA